MAKIEKFPFVLNTRYGILDADKNLVPGEYFKILMVEGEPEYENFLGDVTYTYKVTIEFKLNANTTPVVNDAFLIKHLVGDEADKAEYSLLYQYNPNSREMIQSRVSTVPLPQGGGRRHRKSIRVRRKRGRYSRRN